MTTIDAAAKQQIKQAFLDALGADTDTTEERADDEQAAAETVQDDSHSVDDVWQAQQAADMNTLLDEAVARHAEAAEALAALDVTPTPTVRPGAAVLVGGVHYLVGAVADEVEVAGTSWSGLSVDSPLYQAIEGSTAGTTVTVNGAEQTVELVA